MDKQVEAELKELEKRGIRANPYRAGRTMTVSRHGMVSSPHVLASQAGLEMLKSGGRAMDAALVVAGVLTVTEPMMTGLGGDAFFLYYEAATGKVHGLNGSGRSPMGLTGDYFHSQGKNKINPHSWEAVTVPGSVDAWAEALARFGTKTMADVLAPAIEYAENGFPVPEIAARIWEMYSHILKGNPWTEQTYLVNGQPPVAGQVFKNPNLAASLKMVASGGRDAFYLGPVAEEIVRYAQESGGFLTMEDFAAHSSTWVEPISLNYRGYDVFQIPPNGQGLAVLLMLAMLEGFEISRMEQNSVDYFHLLIEITKLAYADLHHYVADPAKNELPVEALLAREYAAKRRKLFNPEKAGPSVVPGLPNGKETAYFTVMDERGDAVSFINSIYFPFGSTIVGGRTGILLQNRGSGFTLESGHFNEYQPGKRPFHTIIPSMILKDGKFYMSLGLQGGPIQPQVQVQIILSHLDFGLTVQEAIDLPRYNHLGGVDVQFEPGISRELLLKLEGMGHNIRPHTGGIFGGAMAILLDPKTGSLFGACDPRTDGAALGY
jgi:gamma-glutamyltranspeptidase/glutathione hydrolase